MSSVINFKRGLKKNLPTLSDGEIAFTLDTNELFIGHQSVNYNYTPCRENHLVNSNFQIPVESTDYTSLGDNTIAPGTGRYLFGNYYIKNSSLATGNFQYFAPTDANDLLKISCSSAMPSLTYNTKLPLTNFTPLENKMVTLSFDSISTTSFSYQAGVPGATVFGTIVEGFNRNIISFKYNSILLTKKSMQFILFEANSILNSTFRIGNFKIEEGTNATLYTPPSMEETIAFIKNSYYTINENKRINIVNNTKEGYVYFNPGVYIYNDYPKPILKSCLLSTPSNTSITNFSSKCIYNNNSGLIELYLYNITETALTDASVKATIIVDNRPY